jgi:hypothetical protein
MMPRRTGRVPCRWPTAPAIWTPRSFHDDDPISPDVIGHAAEHRHGIAAV